MLFDVFAPFLLSNSHASPNLSLFCLFFTSRLVAPVVRSAVSVRRQKTRTSCHCTECRLRPVALHDSQIETDAQNKNVSLFCVQPATTNLPYRMMELSVTMVTVVTSGNSTVQIVLLIALGMLLEPRRSE